MWRGPLQKNLLVGRLLAKSMLNQNIHIFLSSLPVRFPILPYLNSLVFQKCAMLLWCLELAPWPILIEYVMWVFTNYYNHTCCFYAIVMSPQAALACCRTLARSWLTSSVGVPICPHVRTDWPRSKILGLTPTWLTISSGNHHQWQSTRLSEMQGKRKPICRMDEISEMSDFGKITIFLLKKDMAIIHRYLCNHLN